MQMEHEPLNRRRQHRLGAWQRLDVATQRRHTLFADQRSTGHRQQLKQVRQHRHYNRQHNGAPRQRPAALHQAGADASPKTMRNDVHPGAPACRNQSGLSAATRRRNALVITETELRLIASAATIGDSSQPVNGNSTPAASGTPNAL